MNYMNNHIINLKNRLFGKLKVLKFSYVLTSHAYWLCKCKCGKERIIRGSSLLEGTKSCGCLSGEAGRKFLINNPIAYKNGLGYIDYPKEFNQKLKTKIKQRDSFECQNCDINERQHIKKYNRALEIHHIDYNKFNCKESNLITLCKDCNLRANKNRDYWYSFYTYIMEDLYAYLF